MQTVTKNSITLTMYSSSFPIEKKENSEITIYCIKFFLTVIFLFSIVLPFEDIAGINQSRKTNCLKCIKLFTLSESFLKKHLRRLHM